MKKLQNIFEEETGYKFKNLTYWFRYSEWLEKIINELEDQIIESHISGFDE